MANHLDNRSVRQRLQEDGFCLFPQVLSVRELERARQGLDAGVALTRELLGTTHMPMLDPNAASVRVNNLPAIDPVFIELLLRDDALQAVAMTIGEHFLISNFTANIALPGAGSMSLHSDQALVVPPPWLQPWAMNIIWCLDDVCEANGATRYLPGSHRFTSPEEVPDNALELTVPFEAPAGSFIAMDGRLWHTSGENRTADQQRRMMFAYYSTDFIRQQANWALTLPAEVQASLGERGRALFGLNPIGNSRIAVGLISLTGKKT